MTYASNPIANSKQIIVVIAEDWSSTSGILQRYDRLDTNASWQKVGNEFRVMLGKNGMGWGIGLHGNAALTEGPTIAEGTNRSPVGAFTIPLAVGKDMSEDWPVKLPYQKISETIFCVDDPNSKYYNKLVNIKQTNKDWDSAEDMCYYVNEGLYVYAAMIGHNISQTTPGKGSCFFMHIWRSFDKPTAGCTAMNKNNAKEIIGWIDPQKKPVLVQLPEIIYDKIKFK